MSVIKDYTKDSFSSELKPGDILIFYTQDINILINVFKTIRANNPNITDYSICSNDIYDLEPHLELHLFGLM